MAAPRPLPAWPDIPTKFVVCTEGRCFPADLMRRLARERMQIVPDEIPARHCVASSRPKELGELLAGYAAGSASSIVGKEPALVEVLRAHRGLIRTGNQNQGNTADKSRCGKAETDVQRGCSLTTATGTACQSTRRLRG
jgi:hypothetical protein